MSARIAEPCKENPLKLNEKEEAIRQTNSTRPPAHLCQRDIYIGLFFDGTNNNKFRDLPTHCASNVARLFEAYTGSPAPQTPTYGGTRNRPLLVGAPPEDIDYYRKVYIAGLGTAFPEIKDPGENLPFFESPTLLGDKTRGLAMALWGEERIRWGLLQLLNQVALALKAPTIPNDQITHWATYSELERRAKLSALSPVLAFLAGNGFDAQLKAFDRQLAAALQRSFLVRRKGIRRIRLSLFGFSRGAAEARAFANRLIAVLGGHIGGLPCEIDFMGLFDTVASVGLAHLVPMADGHMGWADGEAMVIPAAVKRCVHLVAAHEVRRCFPLDSVAQGGHTPPNCKEIVYPGVHSDVGGGYGLMDQGRCAGDDDKISQIALAHMYREARMAGVPLVSESEMPQTVSRLFQISPAVRECFNAYIERTRPAIRQRPEERDGQLARMYPTETQPPQPLREVMAEQYGHYLAWRKHRLGDIHALPGLQSSRADSAKQDIYDIWQANEKLKEELDPAFWDAWKSILKGFNEFSGQAGFEECRAVWRSARLDSGKDAAIVDLFDLYVHDSRAWFKLGGESDDEWHGGGKDAKGNTRPGKKQQYRRTLEDRKKALEKSIAETKQKFPNPDPRIRGVLAQSNASLKKINDELALYEKWGDTLQAGGESTQESLQLGAGYLRWRSLYFTGDSRRDREALRQYDLCVLSSVTFASRLNNEQTALERLYAQQNRTLGAFFDGVKQARTRLEWESTPERLRKFDENMAMVMKQITAPMGRQSREVEQRIKELQQRLASSQACVVQ